ncbi:hypothetical protein [Paraburkholderia sediminicola]|uniref:hypothetical protein n=1 Tax=Paraburkholderia sediminicola TaxID=458836 RepID=UPI0038B9F87A
MVVRVVFGFYDVVVKWGNVLFFAFYTMWLWVGFFWRCVEECDFGPAGLGFVGFFVIWFGFYIWVWLFDLWINFVNGLLVLPLCGAALTFFAAAKKDKQRKRLTPPAYKRVPRTVAVVVHLESVLSHTPR